MQGKLLEIDKGMSPLRRTNDDHRLFKNRTGRFPLAPFSRRLAQGESLLLAGVPLASNANWNLALTTGWALQPKNKQSSLLVVCRASGSEHSQGQWQGRQDSSRGFGGQLPSQLSYPHTPQRYSTPGATRTPDTRFRKPLLYPLSYRGTTY